MTKGRKAWQFLGCSVLILLLAAAAQAGTLNVTTTPFTGTDSVGWGSTVGCLSASCVPPAGVGYSFTSGALNGVTVSFSTTDIAPLTSNDGEGGVYEAGGGGSFEWQIGSIFTSGTFLLGTDLNTSDQPNNPLEDTMTLTFSEGVSAVGVYIQDFDQTDSFSATVGTTSDGGYTSPSESSGANGGAFFIGIYDESGNPDIFNISFSTTQSASGGTPGYFVIGAAQLEGNTTGTTTPEPGTILLMAGGLAALAWKARKRVRA
jgi:hypothetical protein